MVGTTPSPRERGALQVPSLVVTNIGPLLPEGPSFPAHVRLSSPGLVQDPAAWGGGWGGLSLRAQPLSPPPSRPNFSTRLPLIHPGPRALLQQRVSLAAGTRCVDVGGGDGGDVPQPGPPGKAGGGAESTRTRSFSGVWGSGTLCPGPRPDRTAVTQRVGPSQLDSRLRPPLPGPGASSLKSPGGNCCVLLTAGDLLDVVALLLAGTVFSTGGPGDPGERGVRELRARAQPLACGPPFPSLKNGVMLSPAELV